MTRKNRPPAGYGRVQSRVLPPKHVRIEPPEGYDPELAEKKAAWRAWCSAHNLDPRTGKEQLPLRERIELMGGATSSLHLAPDENPGRSAKRDRD